ncbi:MAG: hypothetical protein HY554_12020 [Elusimicrobia bacterium]|nr:hypothetical protein [Elusimicrobiota bacterium]
MKCPACGFDSPDDAGWCEFCKEPFRKKGPARPPAAPPAAGPKPSTNGASGVGPEFAHLDSGENIPILPPWLRPAAWAFLALWLLCGLVLLGYYLGTRARSEDGPPARRAP